MFELQDQMSSYHNEMQDYTINDLSDLIDVDFDLSRVKTEPDDNFLFDDLLLEKPVYTLLPQADDVKPEISVDCIKSEDDLSYIDRTTLDIHSSIGNTNRKTPATRRRSVQSKMTEVLQRPEVPTPGRKRSEGKRTGRNSSTPYTTVPLPPCKVCGGVATGFHFGVITCEACKAFFRRALIHKQAYKCLKDDNCEIIDKKLGNCSACRLKKCFALGMSKGGVRRGRYSIAIRTKAIVEAKALEGKDAGSMVPIKRRKLSNGSTDDELSLSASSSSSSDGFDGLLEISDLDESLNMTVTVLSKPVVPVNNEFEFLIDALISCQDAVYPKLKKNFAEYEEDVQFKVFEEIVIKQELFGEVFGKTESLSTEEFQTLFAETGLDIDDRLFHFSKKGKSMEESIAQYVNFAKIVPGFKNLNPKDVSKLLKAAHVEFWMFGNFKLFNKQLGICTAWEGTDGVTKEHMTKFFDAEWIDRTLAYAETLKKLNPTIEEVALIRVIILTYTDRCAIIEREKIQALQEKFVECLQYYLSKTVINPGKRLADIFDRLLAIRDLTEMNVKTNKTFLAHWGFLMHDYPLWKEMVSFDEI